MSNPSVQIIDDSRSIYPELHPYPREPNVPSYISSNPPSRPSQGGFPYQQPNPQTQPLVYYSQPVFPGEAVPYMANPQSESICKKRFQTCFNCLYYLVLIAQLIFIAIALNVTWFSYCYWDFKLSWSNSRHKLRDNNNESIKDLYSDICDPDNNRYPECPHLCSTLSDIKHTGNSLMWFSIASCLIYFIAFMLFIVKAKRPRSKITRVMLYVFILLGCVLFVSGIIYYYSKSNFNSHFDDVDKNKYNEENDGESFSRKPKPKPKPKSDGSPEDLSLGAGFDLSFLVMGMQGLLILGSRLAVGSINAN